MNAGLPMLLLSTLRKTKRTCLMSLFGISAHILHHAFVVNACTRTHARARTRTYMHARSRMHAHTHTHMHTRLNLVSP